MRYRDACFLTWLSAAAMLSSKAALAQGGDPPDRRPVGIAFSLGYERLRLPGSEGLGLVGAALLFDVHDGVWGAGPAVYAAATGQRGGFFVGGVQVEHYWIWDQGYSVSAGLFAGGGGGAAAPVGSGLMLRPSLTLYRDLGSARRLGLTWSSVRFPSGQIASRQFGLEMSFAGAFRQASAESGDSWRSRGESTGLGFDRISATVSRYAFRDGSGRRIGLLGMRAEQGSGNAGLSWGLDAAAAAQGDAAGYMELLGSLAYSARLAPMALPDWRVGLRAALGLGGGGAVRSGGGAMARLAVGTELSPWSGYTLGIDLGVLRGGRHLRAGYAEARLGVELEPGPRGSGRAAGETRLEWLASLQHHTAELRADGRRRALDTVGLTINRYLGEHLYFSAQAHSAYAGGAGAFSTGLLGAGVASATAPLRFGAELLLGAGGGGGVASGGGAISQSMAWIGGPVSPRSEWRLGVGQRRSLRGATGSTVGELSWSRSFMIAR
jgi:hypothetical protein